MMNSPGAPIPNERLDRQPARHGDRGADLIVHGLFDVRADEADEAGKLAQQ